jgi:cytoskeletal protein RodZ
MISIGEELKREREFREISLREISDATKINIRMLEAIEKDNFSSLPGGIFNRNFIRAYANFIGLDPEVIIRKYLVQTGIDLQTNAPASIVVATERGERQLSNTKLLLLFLGIFIVILVLIVLWRFPDRIGWNRSAASMSNTFTALS